jgi:hypothetical protein
MKYYVKVNLFSEPKMKAELLLKREILLTVTDTDIEEYNDDNDEQLKIDRQRLLESLDDHTYIVELWDIFTSDDVSEWFEDFIYSFRDKGEDTNLKPRTKSTHYECKEVAVLITGSNDLYVGWSYFYGGGKHGQPEEIEWMADCYLLNMSIETVQIKVFKPVD